MVLEGLVSGGWWWCREKKKRLGALDCCCESVDVDEGEGKTSRNYGRGSWDVK